MSTCSGGRVGTKQDLLEPIPPGLLPFAERSDRDEERRRKAGGRKDAACLKRVVRVAIVERDCHVAARSIPVGKRDGTEAPLENLAVLRKTIRVNGEPVRVALETSHPVIEQNERAASAH